MVGEGAGGEAEALAETVAAEVAFPLEFFGCMTEPSPRLRELLRWASGPLVEVAGALPPDMAAVVVKDLLSTRFFGSGGVAAAVVVSFLASLRLPLEGRRPWRVTLELRSASGVGLLPSTPPPPRALRESMAHGVRGGRESKREKQRGQ